MPNLPFSLAVRDSRRKALQALGFAGVMAGFSSPTQAVIPLAGKVRSSGETAQAWRAMSRLGYGPTAVLSQQVLAASNPQMWALQQIEKAANASQQLPFLPSLVMGFSGPLPSIFEGARQEREARATMKQEAAAQGDEKMKTGEHKGKPDLQAPEHFSRRLIMQTAAWRLTSASRPALENPLLARLTEFWFNHLNVFAGKGSVRPFVGHYVVHVIRAHALGRFEDLLLASARHPAMLNYLDQTQSVAEGTRGGQGRVRGLNENYARELMELHTLGVNGGYTQRDVRELARILTGWTLSPNDPSGFRFAARLHDNSAKHVMGVSFGGAPRNSGEQEGVDAIRMLARHPATAQRISRRLAQFFVADQPPEPLVRRLSAAFSDSQGDMRVVMRVLLQSPEMWDSAHRLFKTPMDYACSALAVIGGDDSAPLQGRTLQQTLQFLSDAGQALHGWQTPDGYATNAATWLAPEALTRRADFALALARQTSTPTFLRLYFSAATLASVDRQSPVMRAGLMLASPDFMYK